MIEILSFFNSVSQNKWIPLLWNRLKKIRQEREQELELINNTMFDDPFDLARYYIEPDCQDTNCKRRLKMVPEGGRKVYHFGE